MKSIIVSGCLGFIGSQLAEFFKNQCQVIGIDNLPRKGYQANLDILNAYPNSIFHRENICNFEGICKIFSKAEEIDLIILEAGQVVLTTSETNPREDFEIKALGF